MYQYLNMTSSRLYSQVPAPTYIFNKFDYKNSKISTLPWNKYKKIKQVSVDNRISINKQWNIWIQVK